MLILSRKAQKGEDTILIEDSIKVILVSIRGATARIGLECPRDISIVRAELETHDPEITCGSASNRVQKAYRGVREIREHLVALMAKTPEIPDAAAKLDGLRDLLVNALTDLDKGAAQLKIVAEGLRRA